MLRIIKISAVVTFAMISLTMIAQDRIVQRAVCEGNISKLDSLLKTTDINVKDRRGRTLAHYAIGCRQEKTLDFLIKRGIDVNVGDNQNHTPLFVTVQFRNDELFKKLLAANANINVGTSPLHRAVINGDLDFVKQLVNDITDVDVLNDSGNTPLAIAIRQGSTEIAEFLIAKGADKNKIKTYEFSGEFLGQDKPGLEPKIFAHNFVSTENSTHSSTFSPDGKEFYYTVESRVYHGGTIMVSKLKNKRWTTPEPADILGDYREIDPFITSDGSAMYFSSNRPVKEGDSIKGIDLWMVKRKGEKWGKPIHLGEDVNTEYADWFPTISKKGTLFFSTGPSRSSNIVYSEFKNGKYQKAIPLSDAVNTKHRDYDPLIAPDEGYVIFSSNRPEGKGNSDLYVSFKNANGSWTKAKNMGEKINTSGSEFAPGISPDGNYFFYTSRGNIYWVDSKIIQNLKLQY
ncbi:hypothetical protein D7030_11100 [Flavobacteriaceae bacterium AU392]|nr:hypothetical protein D1817_13570 [Flavobacteriaceae bacterium]RKM82707.1 hypothetical protein D7030_11100 [Flavobacteriaceae bacterium AU392]